MTSLREMHLDPRDDTMHWMKLLYLAVLVDMNFLDLKHGERYIHTSHEIKVTETKDGKVIIIL